jgi:ATP sulfurylase
LENIDEIIQKTDYLLLDRGDLSKEISLSKIPFTQKILIDKAKEYKKGFFIATNLLESMIQNRKPTRAEVHDIITTILDGAYGLVMAAETAIGKYPIECINMLQSLIDHVEQTIEYGDIQKASFHFAPHLEIMNYLKNIESSSLVKPHGGNLVNGMRINQLDKSEQSLMPKLQIDVKTRMEIEQIAIGSYSPIDGFMNEADLYSVLDTMRLKNGAVWSLPIVLDVTKANAERLQGGDRVLLIDENNNTFGMLELESKYPLDKVYYAEKLYGTQDTNHPGVHMVSQMNDILLSGKILLFNRLHSSTASYEFTPRQMRKLFEEYGWTKIAGFHTRNIPHKGHEFIIYNALTKEYCDGVFIHPIVGKKKKGDFDPLYVIKSYERMIERAPDPNKLLLGAFSTFSRYAGPKEAIFTALCRKNYGCSHFIIGRDHTGVGQYYHPLASQEIFDQFPDIGISIIKADEVFYSAKSSNYYFNNTYPVNELDDKSVISGTLVRDTLRSSIVPPGWLIDPEISKMLISAMQNNENIFV